MSILPIKSNPTKSKSQRMAPWGAFSQDVDELFENFMTHLPFYRPKPLEAELGGMMLTPKVDVKESKNAYEISAELPGMDAGDIELDLSDGMLTLSGEKRSEVKETKEDNYYFSERRYGSFKRSFALPPSVDEEKISADFRKGVLHIVLPKSEKAQEKQRKIPVKADS